MNTIPRILSVQVGLPRSHGTPGAADPMDRPWRTGFFKEPVAGPVWVGRTNLAGDGQADRRVHGGPEKAVLAYAAAHYPAWREELGFELPYGGFGENLTVSVATEATVCIGDVYRAGDALLQVSQARGPCWKIARRWRIRDLAVRVQRTGRTGWYHRVLEEGALEAGAAYELVERPYPEWSVARAGELVRVPKGREAEAAALAACPALSPNQRATIEKRLAAGTPTGELTARLLGLDEDGQTA